MKYLKFCWLILRGHIVVKKRYAPLLALAALLVSVAHAQTPTTANVVVRWNPVTQCTAGTVTVTCSNPVTYNVAIGTNGPGSEGSPALEQNVTGTRVTLPGYTIGATVVIEVTAVAGGVSGPVSAEISYVVASAPPIVTQQTPLIVTGVTAGAQ